MGTRSLTTVYTAGRIPLLTIYRQWDGYPEGHGLQMAEFLASGTMTHGITITNPNQRQFNGAEDLAAQLLCHLKTGENGKPDVGNVYVMPLRVVDGKLAPATDCGEDYTYEIEVNAESKITLTCWREGCFMFGAGGQSDGAHEKLFSGLPKSFVKKFKKAKETGVAAVAPA
jgi:hypothetical protein